jgi:hypothetical protein
MNAVTDISFGRSFRFCAALACAGLLLSLSGCYTQFAARDRAEPAPRERPRDYEDERYEDEHYEDGRRYEEEYRDYDRPYEYRRYFSRFHFFDHHDPFFFDSFHGGFRSPYWGNPYGRSGFSVSFHLGYGNSYRRPFYGYGGYYGG